MKPRILIIALFLLAVAIAGGLALWREPPPPSSRSEATAPGRPYAGGPNAAAIDAALGFLLRHEEQERPSWQVYALLDYLQRRFGLDEKYRIENAFPRELSGGMAQRAALGRTLCFDPDLLLLDEPFGALDYFTRRALQHDLAALFHSEGKTVVLVTHDVEEALALGQRVLLLDRGRVVSSWTLETPPGARAPDDPDVVRGRREILRHFGQEPGAIREDRT